MRLASFSAIIDGMTAFSLSDAMEVAEFFRLRKGEAQKRLSEIRKAVSHWKQEAAQVRASASEIRLMRDAFEYL